MAIRMKEWGMLAAPGQPVHVRTQGLYGWERVGRSMGSGLGDVLQGAVDLAGLETVSRAGELASFTEKLRGISAEVSEELGEQEVQDWDYSWNAAASPRFREAVQELSSESREAGAELARMYSAQSSIEARRDREVRRVATARGRWEQRLEASVSAGQEEQAACWLEAGRGVFVPEEQMPSRLEEVRSRACRSRWEARLQASPLEALSEIAAVQRGKEGAALPARESERRRLESACERVRRNLRRELAVNFSASLQAGEEIEPSTLTLAAGAGLMPEAPERPRAAEGEPSLATRMAWRRWLDAREDGEEAEQEARLVIASAPLPLKERCSLLNRVGCTTGVAAADRRALSNQLFELYHSGALGCPGDAEAQRSLLALQEEGATLLAEQGAAAVADWVKARRSGGERWVCFDEDRPQREQ